jgi:hypothetical protein
MPDSIPSNASPGDATVGVNGHRPPSLDFRGRREIDWSAIEVALSRLGTQTQAVEMVGRNAQDDVHGQKLADVFELLAEDIYDGIKLLKELLGLRKEVRS